MLIRAASRSFLGWSWVEFDNIRYGSWVIWASFGIGSSPRIVLISLRTTEIISIKFPSTGGSWRLSVAFESSFKLDMERGNFLSAPELLFRVWLWFHAWILVLRILLKGIQTRSLVTVVVAVLDLRSWDWLVGCFYHILVDCKIFKELRLTLQLKDSELLMPLPSGKIIRSAWILLFLLLVVFPIWFFVTFFSCAPTWSLHCLVKIWNFSYLLHLLWDHLWKTRTDV